MQEPVEVAGTRFQGERFNALSHLAGALLAIAGTVVLIVLAALAGDARKVVGVAIFGATLMILYSISTLYHALGGRAKTVLQKIDHCSIYLLIAGTYTPFCLVTLRGAWGWSLLGVEWGLVVVGIFQELRPANEARIRSVVIYVLMGWAAVVAIDPLIDALGMAGFAWLVAGGLFYTLGIAFYAIDTRMAHAHGIWHLFVIAGSATHYFAVMRYVL